MSPLALLACAEAVAVAALIVLLVRRRRAGAAAAALATAPGPSPVADATGLSWATALAHAVDVRLVGQNDHSSAVGDYAVAIGRGLGFDSDRIALLRVAALLHDVGKVAVPDSILRKPGPLTDQEIAIVRDHPVVGAELAGRVEGLEEVAAWILHSHERFDGGGYPDGLAGEAIPIESRILFVADAFDAMTSNRVYRTALPLTEALSELHRCAGHQFDVRCVDILERELRDVVSGDGAVAPPLTVL